MCLTIFENKKKSFYAVKTRSLKSWRIEIFPKGLVHGFGSKFAIFPFFFFWHIGQGNVFYDILDRNNGFLCHKNNKFKKLKNWHFSKGVNPGFWSKNGHFCNFFFRQYRPGKCLLRYSRTKKCLSRL